LSARARLQREGRRARRKLAAAQLWTVRAAADARERLSGDADPRVPPRRYGLPSFMPSVLDRTVSLAIVGAGGLTEGDRMLDIGCGPGQIAIRVAPHLGRDGSYEGFDIDERAIAWCRKRIEPTDPRLHFTLTDVGNDLYNPGGADATSFRFPYPDGTFTLAFAGSVFTHLKPRESLHYLREACRTLEPGGRIASTWFLLNEESEALLASGAARYSALEGGAEMRLEHEMTDADGWRFRTSHPRIPEQRIAVGEDDVRGFYAEAGLEIAEIRPGHWCGRERTEERPGQDLIVAVKPRG
jgi:SAM-dependent methyltransferase